MLQISFGNVVEEDVATVYDRMKAHFPHFVGGHCPVVSYQKLIAAQYEKTGSLPLPYEDTKAILDRIRRRRMPRYMRLIRSKMSRKTFRDLIDDAVGRWQARG